MRHVEDRIQRQCVQWFRYKFPKEKIFASANGGFRSKIEAAIMKGSGVLSGVSDLQIPVPNLSYHGFFIEMKKPGGKVTPNQKEFLEYVKSKNYQASVIYSFDQFVKEVTEYMSNI